jgi:hypothetical protein
MIPDIWTRTMMIRKIIQWSLLQETMSRVFQLSQLTLCSQILRFKSTDVNGDMNVRQYGKVSKETHSR